MKKNQRRVLSSATAVICVLAILLSGTFAWRAVSSALNEFTGLKPPPELQAGGNLHDDFDPETGDKSVYVENTGEKDIYVRIKLNEVLELGTTTAPDTPVWETHVPGTSVAECEGDEEYHLDDFVWTMGNDDPYDFATIVGATGWSTTDYEANDALVGGIGVANTVDLSEEDKDLTAPACEVITMAEYNAKTPEEKADFEGWVYDADGYAYWSQPLAPESATGLLLSHVATPSTYTDDYYYAIDVIMEYVDIEDLPAWLDGEEIVSGAQAGQTADGVTTDADAMLRALSGLASANPFAGLEVGDKFEASGWEWIVIALDGDGNALVATTNVIGETRFNSSYGSSAEPGNEYNGSTLDSVLRGFYAMLETYDASSEESKITQAAQPSDFKTAIMPDDAGKLPTIDGVRVANPVGLSKVDASGETTCFALSFSEYWTYMYASSETELQKNLRTAKRPDVSKVPTELGLTSNFRNESGYRVEPGNQCYWLRDPGDGYMTAFNINAGGYYSDVRVETADSSRICARPALWISTK